jgi:ssDNA-binding Zn-finger/Zn-ribbon topoisomerase 1
MMNRSSARGATVDTTAKIPEQVGEDIILPCKTLPKIPSCKKCGATMVGRANGNTGKAFYSCENWPKTGCNGREDVSESHLMSIPQLANKTCENCRGQTRVIMNSSKNARIECTAPTSCGFQQPIKFIK